MRQSLSNLTLIAKVAESTGQGLFDLEKNEKSLALMMNYYLGAIDNPLYVLGESAENYIPGPSDDFLTQDLGMLELRGHGRHYMAFAELYLSHKDGFSARRLRALMNEDIIKDRPLIDEFSGGNATCFWGEPQ